MWHCGGFILCGEITHGPCARRRFSHLVQQIHDPLIVEAYAHWSSGAASFYLGEPTAARRHLEQGIALYHPRDMAP